FGCRMSEAPIAVIGGGVAGLTAALTITAAGRPCVLFEASDRLGGCCATLPHQNALVEPGASVVMGARMLAKLWGDLGITFDHLLTEARPAVRVLSADGQFDLTGPESALASAIAAVSPADVPRALDFVDGAARLADTLCDAIWDFKMGRGLRLW